MTNATLVAPSVQKREVQSFLWFLLLLQTLHNNKSTFEQVMLGLIYLWFWFTRRFTKIDVIILSLMYVLDIFMFFLKRIFWVWCTISFFEFWIVIENLFILLRIHFRLGWQFIRVVEHIRYVLFCKLYLLGLSLIHKFSRIKTCDYWLIINSLLVNYRRLIKLIHLERTSQRRLTLTTFMKWNLLLLISIYVFRIWLRIVQILKLKNFSPPSLNFDSILSFEFEFDLSPSF